MNDDELERLKAAMRAATPAPDESRKAANLALARERFSQIQGSTGVLRQTPDRPAMGIVRRTTMMLYNLLSNRTALAVTTSAVAVGVLVFLPIRDAMGPPSVPNGSYVSAPKPEAEDPEPTAESLASAELPVELESRTEMPDVLTQSVPTGDDRQWKIGEPDVLTSAGTETELREFAMEMVSADSSDALRTAPVTIQRFAQASPGNLSILDEFPSEHVWRPAAGYTEEFANAGGNPVRVAAEHPVSTFSIDVDTASYSVVRSSLLIGVLPPPEAVRVEEMINYFPYAHPAPAAELPFRPTVSVLPTPWNKETKLLHIAIQGALPETEDRPPLNLVFLIDTSGSMASDDKLPLVIRSLHLLLEVLRPEDEVAIVTYAGSAGRVLDPTPAGNRGPILAALDRLNAGGSTAGQAGLQHAYSTAREMAGDGEVTRVILATDGDFNVGLSDPRELERFIERQAGAGIYLSVLGFGRGNLDDATMQALAQHGNGTAAYIDTLGEARKVLVDQLSGSLFPIADDVKIQVEFNPSRVAEYRLIGYETRALRRQDFNNDAVDAGEVGAGHSVTAIYEITPVGSPARLNDPLRYQSHDVADITSDEFGFLRLRYKDPGATDSQLIELPITSADQEPSSEAEFAAAVAGFGQLLRRTVYLGDWSWEDAIALADSNRGDDPFGYRAEAILLMRLAQSLDRLH